MFETQTDLIELGYAAGPAAQHGRIRTWEVAGTSHADSLHRGRGGRRSRLHLAGQRGPQHVVVQAAFAAFMEVGR